MATIGPDTSLIAWCAASRGDLPDSIWRSTFSTTTIASSTTMPIASTSPKSVSTLIEKPSSHSTANEPMMDTGTATSGINEARHVCRKRTTTMTTSAIASSRVSITESIECCT
jgi:hypothetical protein